MKRFSQFLLSGMIPALLLGSSGCGDNSPKQEKKPKKTETLQAAKPGKTAKKVKKTFADHEEGSLKVRFHNPEEEKKQPDKPLPPGNALLLNPDDPAAAKQEEKISRKEKVLRKSFRTPQPKNSMAARLEPLNHGKIIRWSPLRYSESAGKVRLPAAAVSPDRSIIVIAETLGDAGSTRSTRLVFLDTHSWTLTAVHHLWGKDVRFIAVSPDHTLALAVRTPDPFKTPDEIILLDPWSGTAKQSVPLPGIQKISIDSEKRLWAVRDRESKDALKITVFPSLLKDGNTRTKEIDGENHSPEIAFSADGTKIFLAGNKTLETRNASNLQLIETVPLPPEFITADLLALPDGTVIAAPESRLQRPAIAIRNGRIQEFGEKSAGKLLPLPQSQNQFFGAVMNRRGRISRIALSSLEEQSGVNPEDSRPRTVGDPMAVFAFAHCKPLAVLDEKGCFYLVYRDPDGKRWHKEILFRSAAAP